jgi:nucleotide-binding universal stress UspA family protein
MRKIVVGVDLSAGSHIALAHALDIARTQGGEVVMALADLVPEVPEDLPEGARHAAESYARTLGERLAADRGALAELFERHTGQGVELSQVIADGYPDDLLPKVAADLGADLLVVGSHGRTGLKRLLLGSVAERVVRLAPCHVLVARGDVPSGGYRRIVIGTDFSAIADRAIATGLGFAARDARVDIVHCFQLSPILTPPDAPAMVPAYEQLRDEAMTMLELQGQNLVKRLRAQRDLSITFQLLERPVAHGLDDHAREVGADLVVVGSHGRRGIRRFLLGSVAEVTVRHAPCATLVARSA